MVTSAVPAPLPARPSTCNPLLPSWEERGCDLPDLGGSCEVKGRKGREGERGEEGVAHRRPSAAAAPSRGREQGTL